MKYFVSYLFIGVLLAGALTVQPAYAQDGLVGFPPASGAATPSSNGGALGSIQENLSLVGGKAYGENTITDPRVLLGTLINVFLGVLALIFLILMLYGGYLWMTAMGDQERITKAKETIVPAVIGIVIIVGAYAVTSFVVEGLVRAVN